MTVRVVPKKTRDDVYRFLFTEGVICCKKDRLSMWQGTLGGKKFEVPVHHVWYLMRSMLSRNLIKEQFSWRHFYWFLNDEGIAYLRQYFHLAESVVPNSMKPTAGGEAEFERRPPRPAGEEGRGRGRGRGGAPGARGGRGGYGADRAAYQGGEEGRGRGRGGFRGRGRGGAEGEQAPAAAAAAAPAQE
jgi:small subunit ribosomal protein S10e